MSHDRDGYGRDQGAALRMLLARNAGIELGEPDIAPTAAPELAPAPPAIDRAEIRRILVARGAPERDLEWLTNSAPSVDVAQAYQPTRQRR